MTIVAAQHVVGPPKKRPTQPSAERDTEASFGSVDERLGHAPVEEVPENSLSSVVPLEKPNR